MSDFEKVQYVRQCCFSILPQLYCDRFSITDQIGKIVNALNKLIENNNKLEDYLKEIIREVIESGEIETIIKDMLANYILNVKFPPEGITPAIGDGTADDTMAVQGCINYANTHNGMAVYFPSGSYLVQPIILKDNVSLIGFDRYTTKIVLKGGATSPMLTGPVNKLTLANLTFDGNMDIQVNNINLFDFTVDDMLLNNCILSDGYKLLNLTVNDKLQMNNIIFNSAVENGAVLSGSGYVQADNLCFNSISAILGKDYLVLNNNNSIIEQIKCTGSSPNCVRVNGNNNILKFWNTSSLASYIDSGNNNSFEVYGKEKNVKFTNDVLVTSRHSTENVNGTKRINSENTIETVTGSKTENVTNKIENISSEKSENYNTKNETGAIKNVTISGTSKEEGLHKTLNINGTLRETYKDSIENGETKTSTITGLNAETYNSKTENGENKTIELSGTLTNKTNTYSEEITGNKTSVITGNYSETVNEKTINCDKITINSNNPIRYGTPENLNDYFNSVKMSTPTDVLYDVLVNKPGVDFSKIAYKQLKGKKILIFGDSISDENASASYPLQPNWVTNLRNELSGVATVDNDSLSGRKMIEMPTVLANHTGGFDYDIFIVFLGTNDHNNNVPLGTGYMPGDNSQVSNWYSPAIRYTWEYLNNVGKAGSQVIFVTPLWSNSNNNLFSMDCYRSSITSFCKVWGSNFINGDMLPWFNLVKYPQFMPDGLHPNVAGMKLLSTYILAKLLVNGESIPSYDTTRIHPLPASTNANVTFNNYYATYSCTDKINVFANLTATFTSNIVILKVIDFSTIANLITVPQFNTVREACTIYNVTDDIFIAGNLFIADNNICVRIAESNFLSGKAYQITLKCNIPAGFITNLLQV